MSKKKINIVALTALAVLLIGIAAFAVYISDSIKGYEFCEDILVNGWEGNMKYPMLSRELRDIISEEEFSDDTPEGRLKMYEKLRGLVPDDRPVKKFAGSTHGFKTPQYWETFETDEQTVIVSFDVDVTCLFGKITVRNFTCYF